MNSDLFAAGSLVWPLTVILLALIMLRALGTEVQPIFRSMRDSLAQQAAKNAMAWAMIMMIGASASMQAMIDVCHTLGALTQPMSWWFYLEAFARVVGPGLIAVIALLRPNPQSPPTNPPFPPK